MSKKFTLINWVLKLKVLQNPGQLIHLRHINFRRLLMVRIQGVGQQFEKDQEYGNLKIKKRKYGTYSAYLAHQKSKLDILLSQDTCGKDGINLIEYDIKFKDILHSRLKEKSLVHKSEIVLCLAARLGTEVKAFTELGCFAVGIDLNPGPNNEYVLYGDFHNLRFANETFDVIYCNSLDHAFDLNRMFSEIKRVLKKDGKFIAELQGGISESIRKNTGEWESIEWERVEDILQIISLNGFELTERFDIHQPWEGVCSVFKSI